MLSSEATSWLKRVALVAGALSCLLKGTLGISAIHSGRTPAVTSTFVRVVEEVHHDPKWFTQGLEIHEEEGMEVVYESTGLYGQSRLLKWQLRTGAVLEEKRLSGTEFGEGLTVVHGKVMQLLWKTNDVVVWGRNTWEREEGVVSPMADGWGLAYSEEREVVAGTDGSNKLYLMRPGSLELITAHSIQDNGQAVQRLNEIEWVNGEIWANVWLTDCIVRIDPDSGAVLGWMVLTELHNRLRSTPGAAKPDVLNGIAVSGKTGDIWLTGKQWHRMYHVELAGETDAPDQVALARKTCLPSRGR